MDRPPEDDRMKGRNDATKDAGPGAPKVLGQGRHLTLIDEGGWEYVRRSGITGIVVIVPVTDDGKLILVEQPRTAVHKRTIELPAGLVGDAELRASETLADAASRELVEETGYEAAEMTLLTAGPVAVGVSDEIISFFAARGLRRVGPGGGDDTEEITVHEVPLAGLRAFLASRAEAGLAIDPKIYAGLFLVDAAVPGTARASLPDRPPGRPDSASSASPASPRPASPPRSPPLGVAQGPLRFIPRAKAPGSATWEYAVDPAHYNPHGVLHGGVMMALLDTAMGHAVAELVVPDGAFNAAAQMSVHFLEAVRDGIVTARAEVRKRGKRLAVVEGTATDGAGRLVALATATHSIIQPK